MRMTPSCATWSRWSGAFSRDGGGPGVGRAASGRSMCIDAACPGRGVFHAGASGRGLSAGWGFWIGSGALRCVLFVCGREVSAASTLLTCALIGRPFAGEKTWGVQEPPRSPDASVLRVLLTPSPRRSEAPPTHGIPAPELPSPSRPHPTPASPSTRSSGSCLECTPSLA